MLGGVRSRGFLDLHHPAISVLDGRPQLLPLAAVQSQSLLRPPGLLQLNHLVSHLVECLQVTLHLGGQLLALFRKEGGLVTGDLFIHFLIAVIEALLIAGDLLRRGGQQHILQIPPGALKRVGDNDHLAQGDRHHFVKIRILIVQHLDVVDTEPADRPGDQGNDDESCQQLGTDFQIIKALHGFPPD